MVLAGGKFAKARTSTIRAKLIAATARIATTGRATILHLPEHHRHQQPFQKILATVQGPTTSGLTHSSPANRPRSAPPGHPDTAGRTAPATPDRIHVHQDQIPDLKINIRPTGGSRLNRHGAKRLNGEQLTG